MRLRRPSLLLVDRALAVVFTLSLVLETLFTGEAEGHRLPSLFIWPVVTIAVAFRRRFPTAVGFAAATAGYVAQTFWPSQLTASSIAWMCDLYAVSVWSPAKTFRIFVAAYVAAFFVTTSPWNGISSSGAFFVLVSTIVMVLIRLVVGAKERRASLAERERDVAAREAVVAERARIARELHDVVAHHVSMIVLQAGAERHALPSEQAGTRDVLGTIEQTGRSALIEMRRLLQMLREDEADPLAPQPGLDDLPVLVSQVREAGLNVELEVDGERRDLPVGLELSAYRIVQEALTNALKHAGEAAASVRVRYGEDAIELEVVDDGAGNGHVDRIGGHGLVGMRERVALYGGQFEARRRDEGGYRVRALLPIR
jgi:signal transduction histidine kinase